MKIILDPIDLRHSFAGLAGGQDRLDAAGRDELRRTLDGSRVPIVEHCAPGARDCHFYVTKVERVGDSTGIDLFGVCFTNAAGRADLVRDGLLSATEPPHTLLGDARAEAADRNSTGARRQFATHMQSHAETGDLHLRRLIGQSAGL